MPCPLVIGVGSPHGDDQAGWLVIEKLHRLGVSTDHARTVHSPADLCHVESRARPLIVCDAAETGRAVGAVGEWTWPAQPLPMRRGGTHDLSLGDALSLGVQLGMIPDTVAIWIISGRDFGPLSTPSAAVIVAAEQLAEQFWRRWHHA